MRRLVALMVLVSPLMGCQSMVRYSDELRDERSGRTLFVRTPAQLGGSVGLFLGVPLDVVAFPITYTVYSVQAQEDGTTDQLSYLLFHTFTLWKLGAMLAVPFDMVEYVAWRAWLPEDNLSAEERESLELKEDSRALPRYPVETIYPAFSPTDPPSPIDSEG